MSEVPAGYHHEWVVDESWKLGGEGRRCRMKRCSRNAIAALKRARRGSPDGVWWHYCSFHLYGRTVDGLDVKVRRLVKNEVTA